MEKVLARATEAVDIRSLAGFLAFAGVASILPFYIHIQWLTGPIINAIMIIVLFLSGIRSAMIVALVPSLMALSGGLLPVVLAPMVPFIMISNVIYVLAIDWLYKSSKSEVGGYWFGVVFGSIFKFLFLLASVRIIAKLLLKSEFTMKVAEMLSWPQLATALIGGIIAFFILRWMKRL